MKVTQKQTAPGWVRIDIHTEPSISDPMSPSAHMTAHLDAVAEIPGVSVHETDVSGHFYVNVPYTVRGCEAWERFDEAVAPWAGGPSLPAAVAPRGLPEAEVATVLGEITKGLARRPFVHQATASAFLAERGRALLADEMGLGKSTSAALAAEALLVGQPAAHVLIIGPKYLRTVWKHELTQLGLVRSDEDFAALTLPAPSSPTEWAVLKRARWWFCHYDIAADWAHHWVLSPAGRPHVAIVDEAQWGRNPRAKRTRALHQAILTFRHRILLTGTPVPNRPSELWSLLTLVSGPGSWGSHFDFRRRYCGAYHTGYGWVDSAPSNVEELRARLQNVYLRRTTEDAGIELPPLTRTMVQVETSAARRFRHTGASPEDIARLLGALRAGTLGPDTLAILGRLQRETSRAKVPHTSALIADAVEQHEPLVVFVHEREVAERLAAAATSDGSIGGTFVHGGLPQEERDKRVAAFQSGSMGQLYVLVATYGALREGVTLHRARNIVLHDLQWVPGDLLQAEKRVHRIGQVRNTCSRWMVLRDSFDVLLAAHLLSKGEAIATTVGDDKPRSAFAEAGLGALNQRTFDEEVAHFLEAYT